MNRWCRLATFVFGSLYVVALGLLAIGTFGLFGNERDPLAGVFLLPLGLPWNLLTGGGADTVRPWLAAAAPLVNLPLVWLICRTLRERQTNAGS